MYERLCLSRDNKYYGVLLIYLVDKIFLFNQGSEKRFRAGMIEINKNEKKKLPF